MGRSVLLKTLRTLTGKYTSLAMVPAEEIYLIGS